jgi:catechol 2,3-dioxygenase-like lactoylglutathione lyase family enzyme
MRVMRLFRPAGTNYMPVLDIPAAAAWYVDVFGLRQYVTKFDDGQKGIELSDSDNEVFFVLGPRDVPTNDETPMLYTSRIEKARSRLIGRGVTVGEIQRDRQNTRFFEMRDLEGNVIEICDEP